MVQPRFVPLDSRGLDYVRDHLTGANALCTALFDVVTLSPGDVFTLAPPGIDPERLYRFTEGAILHGNLELVPTRLSDGTEVAPIESFKVEQAALIVSMLREEPDSVCIIDDFNPRWSERPPWLAQSAFGVGVRASYYQETEAMVERLTKDRGITRISIFYQDDAFGRAGFAGVQKALDARGMKAASEGTFERNTVAVKTALLSIRKGHPEAIIMVGPYKPCAEFIKLARQIKLDALFVNISFVGSNALAKELGPLGAGVIISLFAVQSG